MQYLTYETQIYRSVSKTKDLKTIQSVCRTQVTILHNGNYIVTQKIQELNAVVKFHSGVTVIYSGLVLLQLVKLVGTSTTTLNNRVTRPSSGHEIQRVLIREIIRKFTVVHVTYVKRPPNVTERRTRAS